MQARLSFLVLLFSALLLLLASPAFSAGGSAPTDEGVSPRCEAAIDKAAGSYSQCLLKASAKFAKRGNQDRLLAQQAKCGDQWNARVARVQDRIGEDQCTPSDLLFSIADRTASNAEDIANEASGELVLSLLYVQNATGGTLAESTLTLTGVSDRTAVFSDRPHRFASRIRTADFISWWWNEGESSFAENPPNADFTCESGGEVVNYPVELSDPKLDGEDLSYRVTPVATGVLPEALQCDSLADLFIDGGAGNTNGTGMGYGRPYICPHADQEPLGITIGGSALAGTPCYCPNMSPVDYALYNPNHVPKCSGGTFVACCIFHAD